MLCTTFLKTYMFATAFVKCQKATVRSLETITQIALTQKLYYFELHEKAAIKKSNSQSMVITEFEENCVERCTMWADPWILDDSDHEISIVFNIIMLSTKIALNTVLFDWNWWEKAHKVVSSLFESLLLFMFIHALMTYINLRTQFSSNRCQPFNFE